ncbi:MAG TPA: ABC transporter permease [Bacteroidia bacterium]|nr:ABC transporter permease [Bacteroidia bacterium]
MKAFFKIAFRNLWKRKVFSFLNIAGLSIALCVCFLIFQYISFESDYDNFHVKGDRIYRVSTDIKTPTDKLVWPSTPSGIVPRMKQEFPEIESQVRLMYRSFLFRKDDKKFQEDETLCVDSSFFSLFSFPLLKGDTKKALSDPLSVILTETAAKKYFGSADPMGQTLLFSNENLNMKVTGVMKDFPLNSHFRSDLLVSMATMEKFDSTMNSNFGGFNCVAYILLKKGTDPQKLAAKLPAFTERNWGKQLNEYKMRYTFYLERLEDLYMRSDREAWENGSITNVYIFSTVAVFILLLACINFINLTTARAAERSKEVGVRKVTGATRPQLIRQFLGESVLVCILSFVFSLLLITFARTLFNDLSGKTISEGIFQHGGQVLLLLLVSAAIGLLAGIYPAFVLSGFKPISVLKGRFVSGRSGTLLRKTLVISQFTISIALIVCTLIAYKQLNFMQSQNTGFKKEQMLVVEARGDSHMAAFINEVKNVPGVISSCVSSGVPDGSGVDVALSVLENNHGDMQTGSMEVYFVSHNFLKQYQIPIIAGRDFSMDLHTDSTEAMIVNECTLKEYGYISAKEAIGKKFEQWGRKGQIIGVVKDFHNNTLQKPIKPLSLRLQGQYFGLVSLSVAADGTQNTVQSVQKVWEKLIPYRPFDYYFLDDKFNEHYRGDARFGKLFLYFSSLAIFISCLGLLGLSSYSTFQRTKEIGIRKVLGASVTRIVSLLTKEFFILVLISFVIATPLAWYAMHKWLQDYAYRIEIHWWVFMLSGLLALFIALFTVSFQAVKAAVANPVKSLRTE